MTTWGSYGFEIHGLREPERFLRPAVAGWPVLAMERSPPVAETRPPGLAVGDVALEHGRATVWLADDERLTIERDPLLVRYATRGPLSDDQLVHPYLALPIAVACRWLGRPVLHGGGFAVGGGAVAVVATKEGGKSSTLAWMHRAGHAVLSDDLLVLDGAEVFAGPATIDLRRDASIILGGEQVQGAGRERWRLRPGAVPPASPLRAIVHLEWGDDVALEPVDAADRLGLLVAASALEPGTADAVAYLELASVPTWRLRRPRRLDALDAAGAQLLDALA